MRIKLLCDRVTALSVQYQGSLVDLPAPEARRLIEAGSAEAVTTALAPAAASGGSGLETASDGPSQSATNRGQRPPGRNR